MEHILLSNYKLADEALDAAYSMCDGDPLLINERAVMAFNHGEYVCGSLAEKNNNCRFSRSSFDKAAKLFQAAVDLAQVTQSSQRAWATTYLNLGTCYRKLKSVSASALCVLDKA